jgi:hypothetical protein
MFNIIFEFDFNKLITFNGVERARNIINGSVEVEFLLAKLVSRFFFEYRLRGRGVCRRKMVTKRFIE